MLKNFLYILVQRTLKDIKRQLLKNHVEPKKFESKMCERRFMSATDKTMNPSVYYKHIMSALEDYLMHLPTENFEKQLNQVLIDTLALSNEVSNFSV